MPKRTARSILFVAVTGEDKGLLGSDYFAHFPTVPKQSMVAALNMDGCTIFYQFNDVIPMGAEHSSLGPLVQRDADRLGLKVSPRRPPRAGVLYPQ